MFTFLEKFLCLPDASSPERYIAVERVKAVATVVLNLFVIAAVIALICITPGVGVGLLGGTVLVGHLLTDRLK